MFIFLIPAGLEVGKQRLLSAHLPLLPASITERDRMSYLSSCITFDSPLMVGNLWRNPQICNYPVKRWDVSVSKNFFSICVYVCTCWLAQGSGRSAKMSGQEESGSGAGRQQCWSSDPTIPCLHTVRPKCYCENVLSTIRTCQEVFIIN